MLAALAASLSTAPAHATQGMACHSADGDVEIAMSLGSAGGLALAGASLRHEETRWVTDPAYGEGDLFTFGQGFADATGIQIDFFDEIVNDKVAELRLSRAEEDADVVHAGTLRIIRRGVWAVACAEQ